MKKIQDRLRALPGVDKVLREDPIVALADEFPQVLVTEAIQQVIIDLRQSLLAADGEVTDVQLLPHAVATEAAALCRRVSRPSLQPVINATGTLLHTNLGRAPLAEQALEAISATARGYSNLELTLETGKRGHRFDHVESLICRLTGAEAALVVNNNAGAVLLALTALGKGREAIVSRGELVEIGGAFRIPDVMEAGGLRLKEVGSTNRTHLRDYENAISDETAMLVKAHTSNYRIVGFTSDVPARDLVPLAKQHDLIVLEDLGSGMLFDLSAYGLPQEPTVTETVEAGVDVITFSGDKLLGGPQAGIIVGRSDLLAKIKHHPLARALRIDKLTLAALEATLRLYLDRKDAINNVPLLRMLDAEQQGSRVRCQRLLDSLQGQVAAELEMIEDFARVGGGAMPLAELADTSIAIRPTQISMEQLAYRLRTCETPVMGRLQDERFLVNTRAVTDAQMENLVAALKAVLARS
ncbi:MAG: L-seryl-tRNA(Sec) selenium transferase [Desulfuromonas sp.]|nr:MAG: L-seryl-tRNA(Sec) selenium transferase [Desulfuromonas sp.]